MGQVLGFGHCKEAPSTASTTPDSTEGGPEEPDFPELQAAQPPPEEEEEEDEGVGGALLEGGGRYGPPPRELTFSYIAFAGGGGSRRGRPPPHPSHRLSSGLVPPPHCRGQDPRGAARGPPHTPTGKRGPPQPPPAGGQQGVGRGAPITTGVGGTGLREPPVSRAPPAQTPPLPSPFPQPAGTTAGPPFTEPPPDPPINPEPPPTPPDQSGSDVLVWELLLWRCPCRSALALLGTLGTLGLVARYSVVAVGAYGALAVLGVTVPIRLHRVALRVLRRGQPEGEGRVPPGAVGLSVEQQQRWAQRIARHVAAASRTLTRLFLVHSLPESLKLAFMFYLLTYVGAVFNGVTLLGVGVICAFTFPVLYRHRQAQIDHYMSAGRNQLRHLRARLRAALPSAKAKPE